MNFYTVLEATNRLILRNNWTLQRCRRQPLGSLRYVVVDQHGLPVISDDALARRRTGFTLSELLFQLGLLGQGNVSKSARNLLQQLNDVSELELNSHCYSPSPSSLLR
jgi:hypothetical protein